MSLLAVTAADAGRGKGERRQAECLLSFFQPGFFSFLVNNGFGSGWVRVRAEVELEHAPLDHLELGAPGLAECFDIDPSAESSRLS
ncbi:hypothetical protein ANO11243_026770 [Dothideomycetidae sp. 11243]|nr:hypothetical protein ANO11243_026770 [fungal sp. No.11243]